MVNIELRGACNTPNINSIINLTKAHYLKKYLNKFRSITHLYSYERTVDCIFATNSSASVYPGTAKAPTFRHIVPPMSREYHTVPVMIWKCTPFLISFVIITFRHIFSESNAVSTHSRKPRN